MQQSSLLMSAKIHFIEGNLSLIHIPLDKYDFYLPTVLKLLFPASAPEHDFSNDNSPPGFFYDDKSWANKHAFLNVSVTPIECSIVCETELAKALFRPVIHQSLNTLKFNGPSGVSDDICTISDEAFVAISIEGAGMEAGQRVLELTTPLALAGISLFFITTYFSDYILTPAKAKGKVVRALEDRGFTFEKASKTYVNPAAHHRHVSSGSSIGSGSPTTPPPKNPTELQARTFNLLHRHGIVPVIPGDIHLVQCAGRNENPETFETDELALQHGLTTCLLHKPNFLSLTMTKEESASLLLEHRLMSNFDMSGADNVLLGAKDDILVPITLDLASLPFEATGIVCGVAGRLVDGSGLIRPIDMNYLSTASAGIVIVNEHDLETAIAALRVNPNEQAR